MSKETTILGKWESIENEIRPNPWGGKYFLHRYFHNSETEAHGTLVFYTDDTYVDKNITVEVIGPYQFLKPSATVEGATETDFEFTKIAVTPHSQAMVDMLNGIPSDYLKTWEANVRQEVSNAGQGIMGMVIGEYKEYDLTKVDGDLLYYGERPADGSAPDTSDKRASSLQVPLKKVADFSLKF
jgi:Adenomatosis polyposis coli down-regulated 1